MRSTRIEGADPKPIGAPEDWSEETHGHCDALFVRRELVDGIPFMRSGWQFDPGETLQLLAGASVNLGISGRVHPVIQFTHGTLPEQFEPVLQARRITAPGGQDYVRADMLFAFGGGRHAFCEKYLRDRSFAETVAECVGVIEALARREGWM